MPYPRAVPPKPRDVRADGASALLFDAFRISL